MRVLNNVTTEDSYTDENTLDCPMTERIDMIVANNAIYDQMSEPEIEISWRAEVYRPPGQYTLYRTTRAVRVRSAVPGSPAQVTIEALNATD